MAAAVAKLCDVRLIVIAKKIKRTKNHERLACPEPVISLDQPSGHDPRSHS
jgi:hypothetical protein